MNIPENREQIEELVLRYLYDDLEADERAGFEAELARNDELKSLLERERHLDRAIPRGTAPFIDQDRLDENRRLLRRGLQKQVANRSAVGEFLRTMLRRPSLVALQTVALVGSFALGFLVPNPSGSGPGILPVGALSPLSLVGAQDYEISDMQIESFDPVSGQIDLSFAVASETRLNGNVSDVGIRTLMTVALLNEIDAAARLDTIEALQKAVHEQDVTASMIRVLATDDNPGVRYSAVLSLVDHVENHSVRDALRRTLQEDTNPGIRVEAFNALAENPDAETLDIFRESAEVDGNDYIRERASAIVNGIDDNLTSVIF